MQPKEKRQLTFWVDPQHDRMINYLMRDSQMNRSELIRDLVAQEYFYRLDRIERYMKLRPSNKFQLVEE